jgi:hypothetical protein
MSRIRRGCLNQKTADQIWQLSLETGRDYAQMLVIIIGGIQPSKVTPQLKYHYTELVAAMGYKILLPELELIRRQSCK